MEKIIKKNLLDLEFNKNLQYFNTSLIIIFTYFIGIFVAFLTKQIDFMNFDNIFKIGLISILFLSIAVSFMFEFKRKLRLIPKQISNL